MFGWKDYITVYVAEWENVDAVRDSNQSLDLAKTVVARLTTNS
jgi:hypothetical protein